ncbi:MAG: hypothetical protein HC910_21960 [Spirulinaceae cyanobacterium SM2_1_0]|nr:hypothetical protein [Spirulinaceae cyanobacterium SM2_1_0]
MDEGLGPSAITARMGVCRATFFKWKCSDYWKEKLAELQAARDAAATKAMEQYAAQKFDELAAALEKNSKTQEGKAQGYDVAAIASLNIANEQARQAAKLAKDDALAQGKKLKAADFHGLLRSSIAASEHAEHLKELATQTAAVFRHLQRKGMLGGAESDTEAPQP